MAVVLLRSIAGEELLGPLRLEEDESVSTVKQRLRETVASCGSGDLRLLLGSEVVTKPLRGGSMEEPLVLTVVVSEQSYRVVAWGQCTETPQWRTWHQGAGV